MKLLAALAISVSILAAQTDRAALHTVTAIRHWTLTDVTRVAVEVSGDFEFATERLHNPERVYFDIKDSRLRIESRHSFYDQIDDQMVKRLRAAEPVPGVSRIVLDLAGPVDIRTSQLANPSRLIIELRTGTAPPIPTVAPAPATSTSTPVPAPAPRTVFSPPPQTFKPIPPPVLPPQAPAVRTELPRTEMPAVVRQPSRPPAPPVEVAPEPMAKVEVAEKPVPEPSKVISAPIVESPGTPLAGPTEPGKAARRTASGETSLVRALGLKVTRVVIDPGHGGHDHGTEGPKGLLEKDLVLDVSKRLGKLIEDRMGAEVIYTRSDDTFVPLEGRTAIANDKKADLFLSIHANSSPIPRISGVETYYLNFTDVKEAMEVATRENASAQKSVYELHDIIQKITLHDKAEESKEFAGRIQTSLYSFSAKNFPNSKNRGVKKAPFVVLIGANMPSVLAEIGFLSNAREETLLKRPDYRQKLAEALFRGVSRYADSLSHFQVAQAKE